MLHRSGISVSVEKRKYKRYNGHRKFRLYRREAVWTRAQDMNAAMSALEAYIHAEDTLDPLICMALIHYFVFKTCHNHIYVNDGFQKQAVFLSCSASYIAANRSLFEWLQS